MKGEGGTRATALVLASVLALALDLERDGMSAVSGSGPDRDLWPWAVGGRKSSGAQEEEREQESVPEGEPLALGPGCVRRIQCQDRAAPEMSSSSTLCHWPVS